MTEINMVIVWLVIFVVFLLVEVATVGLISVWFCFGSFAAMIAASFHWSPLVQLVLFFAVSILLLMATKPFVKKILKIKFVPTNADRILEERGIVTEEINHLKGTGAVKVDGKEWTARSKSEMIIETGKEVRIIEIQGVKVIVEL